MNKYRRQEINGEKGNIFLVRPPETENGWKTVKKGLLVYMCIVLVVGVNLYSKRCWFFFPFFPVVSYVLAPIGTFLVKMVEFFSEAKNGSVECAVPFLNLDAFNFCPSSFSRSALGVHALVALCLILFMRTCRVICMSWVCKPWICAGVWPGHNW